MRTIYRYFSYTLLFFVVIILVITIIANTIVLLGGGSKYSSIEETPTTTISVVLGGGMVSEGVMSDLQTDRVLQAVNLYKAGKTGKIIMSGDDGAFRDNEVLYMRDLALAEGVPESVIEIDPHAYRTYLTCYRAKYEWGIESMLVITQDFHIPRTLYLCRGMGIDTSSLSANLRPHYAHMLKIHVREVLARVKAVWQLHVVKPVE